MKKKPVLIINLIVLIFLFIISSAIAQKKTIKKEVYVDEFGVMRWGDSNKEVHGFGVNYTVPFAHAYRSAQRMNIDPKKAIDNDVYHFSRLGFDLFRVHVWDTEISDTLGNLVANAHLDAFDYLLKKLKEKGINYVITPIAFWGNGWPEPDEDTPGFSHKYGKNECLSNPEAIKAQQNYLFQFLNHVNPYTGVAYKDEPNIIAFEISNEPHHRGEVNAVTEFIKGMVDAMRNTGCEKPIFYNISHAVHFADAYFNAGIQGGTFQWYPTGLGYQRELSGNYLPNVNDYNIPFDLTIKKHHGAKLVYEFDAADIGKSYIYPAIARSFRKAGIQIATHFAYDPTYLAYANTEYNTHFMNLVYTPQKALSLMISAEVFHQIPMYNDFGTYPQNATFGQFKVDYLNDLAEYNSESKFMYTNTTHSKPVNEKALNQIAGFGNSELVEYDGVGAYFVDKIENGVWRLEVMPDAAWVENPFGKNSPNKTVAVIKYEERLMRMHLKDLGEDFTIEAINEGNDYLSSFKGLYFTIKPGTYILSKKDITKKWHADDKWGNNELSDFYAPPSNLTKIHLNHTPLSVVSDSSIVVISAQIIAPQTPDNVELWINNGFKREVIQMKPTNGYNYSAELPKQMLTKGYLNYYIIVKSENQTRTFPADAPGNPYQWDFWNFKTYETGVVPSSFPIPLFNAKRESDLVVKQWRRTLKLVPIENEYEAEYQLNIDKLFVPDNENLNAEPINDYSFKHFILDRIKGRMKDLSKKEKIVFQGRALNDKPCLLQIALVMNDGSSYGAILEIGTDLKDYEIQIKDLKPVKTVTLPRPYPSFLPYYFEHNNQSDFDIDKVESVQFSIGPGFSESELKEQHGIGIVSLRLE